MAGTCGPAVDGAGASASGRVPDEASRISFLNGSNRLMYIHSFSRFGFRDRFLPILDSWAVSARGGTAKASGSRRARYCRLTSIVFPLLYATVLSHHAYPCRFRRGDDAAAELFQREQTSSILLLHLGDVVNVFQRDRALGLVSRALPSPANAGGLFHEVCHGRRFHFPLKRFVLIRGDHHGDGRVRYEVGSLRVESLAKLHNVQAVLPERGTHGRRGFRRSRGDHELDLREDGARHDLLTPAAARIENGTFPVSCHARGVLSLESVDSGTRRDESVKRLLKKSVSSRRLPRGLALRRVQSTGGRSNG